MEIQSVHFLIPVALNLQQMVGGITGVGAGKKDLNVLVLLFIE
jgi:hypothetical protein